MNNHTLVKYFDRQGNPISFDEFSKKQQDLNYRILKQDKIDRYFVSTIWLGLNMRIFLLEPIQIFETMIFLNDEEKENENDPLHLYQDRYSTEAEAFAGHEKALELCREQIRIRNFDA